MHGYCSTCAFMHNFTPTNVGIFWVKMCKMKAFCILQHFVSFFFFFENQFLQDFVWMLLDIFEMNLNL